MVVGVASGGGSGGDIMAVVKLMIVVSVSKSRSECYPCQNAL